jgi:hypothetical protein
MNVNGTGQTPSSITLPITNNSSIFLIKYNSSGIAQWATYLDGTSSEIGSSIAIDSLNYIYITGRYNSTSSVTAMNVNGNGNGQTPSSITLPISNVNAVLVIKYNSSGIAQWATYLDGTSSDIGNSIAIDSLDNIYVTGIYNSASSVTVMNVNANGTGQTPSSITLPITSLNALFLIKFNSSGIAQWVTYLDGTSSDTGNSIAIDSLNNIYVTGFYNSTSSVTVMNVNGNGNGQTSSSITLPITSLNALFLIKYNSSGIAQWATCLDGTSSDIGNSIAIDSLNNIYVTGVYNSTSSVTVMNVNSNGNGQTSSSITLPITSNNAMLVIKYI